MLRGLLIISVPITLSVKPFVRLHVSYSNGQLRTSDLRMDDGTVLEDTIIDFNYSDLIIPINCQQEDCPHYDPKRSDSFRYCDLPQRCYDRMSPLFNCAPTVSSEDWDVSHATITNHLVPSVGNVTTFEMTENIWIGDILVSNAAMKGSVSKDVSRAILGVGPSRLSCRNKTWTTESSIHYMQLIASELQIYRSITYPLDNLWSEQYQFFDSNSTAILGKFAFNMYHPTLCGSDLLGNVSSHWTTIIDSSETCLMLPAVMFDSFNTWRNGSDGYLYFALSEADSSRSRYASILVKDVCVKISNGGGKETDFVFSGNAPIVLGSSILLSMNSLGFEMVPPFRLLFEPAASPPTLICEVERPVCIGDSFYNEPLNKCIPPQCAAYLFSELDPLTMGCVWKSHVPILLVTLVSMYFVTEVVANFLRKRAIRLAQAACDHGLRT